MGGKFRSACNPRENRESGGFPLVGRKFLSSNICTHLASQRGQPSLFKQKVKRLSPCEPSKSVRESVSLLMPSGHSWEYAHSVSVRYADIPNTGRTESGEPCFSVCQYSLDASSRPLVRRDLRHQVVFLQSAMPLVKRRLYLRSQIPMLRPTYIHKNRCVCKT